MTSHHAFPKPTRLSLAVTAALASLVSLSAQADCVSGGTVAASTNGNVNWASGNCTVNPNVIVSDFFQQTALISSNSVGTLSNSGTLTGFRYGLHNNGTVTAITNNSGGLIAGESVSGIGLFNSLKIGTLTNNGKITAGSTGMQNAGSIGTLINNGSIVGSGGFGYTRFVGINNLGTITTLTNNSGAVISGGSTGIFNSAGATIGTLINSGQITVSNGPNNFGINNAGGTMLTITNMSTGVISGRSGIVNSGTIGTLSNSGQITGTNFGIQSNNTITLLQNNSGGTISGRTGISITGGVGTLTNGGIISGSALAILNGGGANIGSLGNSGQIQALVGIRNQGNIATLGNTGTILASGIGTAIGVQNSGSIGSLSNSGTISAGDFGVSNSGTITTLTNGGTIIAGTAIQNQASGVLGTIANSGLIAGNIVNSSANALNFSGTGGTLTGPSAGLGSADMGAITSNGANLNFTGGSVLLNDSVNLNGGTFSNSAAMQVNNTVSITGNYSQGAGGSLIIGVTNGAVAGGNLGSDSGYSRLVVSGSATVASGSSIVLKPLTTYAFAPGQRFVVIDASSTGTSYNVGSLNYSATGYSGAISGLDMVNGAREDLVVNLVSPTAAASTGPATDPNAVAALGGLANYTGISPQLLNLFNAAKALNLGSSGAANSAGKQLNPNGQNGMLAGASIPFLNVLDLIFAHLDGLRFDEGGGGPTSRLGGPSFGSLGGSPLGQFSSASLAQPGGGLSPDVSTGMSAGDTALGNGVWVQAFGGHTRQDQRDQVDGNSTNFGGFLVGADTQVGKAWRLGGALSYANASINNTGDTSGDHTKVDSYGLTAYAGYTGGSWYANLSGAIARQRYDANRNIAFTGFSGNTSASFNGMQYVARGEAGLPLALGAAVLTPLAGLTYSRTSQDSYTESGGNGAALAVGSAHANSVKSDLGARLSRSWRTSYGQVTPDVQLAWRHEYDNTRAQVNAAFAADGNGATSFTSVGARPVQNTAQLSAGVTLLKSNDLSLSVRYQVEAGSGYLSQAGGVRLQKLF